MISLMFYRSYKTFYRRKIILLISILPLYLLNFLLLR